MDRIVVKLNLETRAANIIHSYEAGLIKIRQISPSSEENPNGVQHQLLSLTNSVIITPDYLIQDWLPDPQNLSKEDMNRIIETKPEVILLGTGSSLTFPESAILQQCYQRKIGIEVMNTAAACRTYNVLASEYRKVTAALMVI